MPAPYVPATAADQRRMLDVIGVAQVDDLFLDIPSQFRDPPTHLPPALSEHDVLSHLARLADRNWTINSQPSFLGGGFASHFIPSVVPALTSRGEFLTPYTPYQPEASQGILQALFEYQSAVCQLTGMDASNTGMYDGASALAEAALMACRLTRRHRVAVDEGVSPAYRRVLATYLEAQGVSLDEQPDSETACLILQEPTFLGRWKDPDALSAGIHALGGLLIVAVEPVSLALFRPPSDYGADIVVAEGQPLGIPLGFGGPGVGIFACRQEFLRQMPGRIVGRSVDADGRDAFVLTLQTREQHIRRERATSNICTAETLAAIAVAIHVGALGRRGLRRVAEACYHKAHYAAGRIAAIPGYRLEDTAEEPFLKEFTVRCPIPVAEINQRLMDEFGIIGGLDVSDIAPNGMLLCFTETTPREDIDRLVHALSVIAIAHGDASIVQGAPVGGRIPAGASSDGGASPDSPSEASSQGTVSTPRPEQHGQVRLLMDLSQHGRGGTSTPALDVPETALPAASVLRPHLELPEVSEMDLVRYFTRISQSNYSVDTHFYPLGSCTMKYNPRVNETAAAMPGFARIHPFQPSETVQGALEVMYELQTMLAEITGMDATSLAPSAGAHGELTGMLLFRAYHRARNAAERTVILAPDSSHGTNPASAAMAGFRLVPVPTDSTGNVDIDALRGALGPEVAGLMLTMPTTLGLFDPKTAEICRLVHEAGGLVYGDGANLNALVGRVRLGDLGVDVVHINVHKTFSTPHGGGGPGAGPVCVKAHLASFLPAPIVVAEAQEPDPGIEHRREATSHHDSRPARAAERPTHRFSLHEPEHTVGRIGSAWGNFGILLRAYTYLRMHGADGLREVSGAAVLNANYIRVRLREAYDLPHDRVCMHETVFSAGRQKLESGVRAGDICKRLLDYGFYAPTVYFPLIVDEALMIEPTETESPETLDEFIGAMLDIAREAREDPDLVRNAPHTTPVRRIDEARAARQPDLKWRPRSLFR